jgi:hypothetical protein
MSTKTDSSLKARGERQQPTEQRPRGNYRNFKDNVLKGLLYQRAFAGEFLQEFQFTPGQLINLLVFCQDVPIDAEIRYQYNAVTVPSAIPVLQWISRMYLDQGLNGAAPAILTPDPSLALPLQRGQQLYGETATNGVPVAGYFLQSFTVDWGLEDGEGAISPLARASIITKGAVCEGDIETGLTTDFTRSFLPVFLWEQDYTQAMADAGNTFTTGDGFGGTLDVKILGIFDNVAFA